MNRLLLLAYLLIWLSLSTCTCGDDSEDCDPNRYCETTQPDSGNLYLNVTINAQNPAVPVAVYRGYLEDNDLYFTDTITQEQVYYVLEIDERYSATAKYLKGTDTIVAVDGGRLDYTSFYNCGYRCYETDNLELELQLKD